LRLARYFGNSPGFWMALQASFDLEEAQVALGTCLERQIQPRAA
jgi:plasmid maintenance system antidote protein VapI